MSARGQFVQSCNAGPCGVRWTFTLLGHPGEALTETLDNRIIELPISGLLTVERKNDKGDYLQGWSLYLHASYIMDFLIPIPMFLSHYIFSEKFFTAVVFSIIVMLMGIVMSAQRKDGVLVSLRVHLRSDKWTRLP
jgi:hypothetical protein